MIYLTRGLQASLCRQAADREPEAVTIPLAVTPAGDLSGADLDPETPVFTHFYLPRGGDSLTAVFGVDLGTPVGQTQGRFVSHPNGELRVRQTDDFKELIFVAVPPWNEDSLAVFDRGGERQPLELLNVEPPQEFPE